MGPENQLDEDVVLELNSILKIHDISAQEMYFKWQSYCSKLEQPNLKLNMQNACAFKQDLQDALERSVRSHTSLVKIEKRTAGTSRATALGNDVFGMLDGMVPNTPGGAKFNRGTGARNFQNSSISRLKQEPTSSSDHEFSFKVENQPDALPPSSFDNRANPGEIIEVLNGHIPASEPPICPFNDPRVLLKPASEKKKLGYKNLVMRLSDVSAVLDDRILAFMKLVLQTHDLDESVLGSAAAQSTSDIIAVGRIVSDSLEGKLNSESLMIEMSREVGNGKRVSLDMGKIRYQFFPGQIVALKGRNGSGDKFVVSEILDIPLLDSAASTRATMQEVRKRMKGDPDTMEEDDPLPLNFIVASGPYTADDNLEFEPFEELCKVANSMNADAIILCGPFIDTDHPMIAAGDFDLPDDVDLETATMETVFKVFISPHLNALATSNPSITIVMVPSIRDVINKAVSWPQEDFPRRGLSLPKQARVVGNPMSLWMNEILLGVSTQDILSELRVEEVNNKHGDMLARLSRYLIQQRHYFPLFPPTDRNRLPPTGAGASLGAMLDIGYLQLGEMMNARPDVMIVPSALPAFAKIVESVLVINPGYLSKRRGAGTYAKITVLAPDALGDKSPEEEVGHELFRRARVEIKRI